MLCRILNNNKLSGRLPKELGDVSCLTTLCAPRLLFCVFEEYPLKCTCAGIRVPVTTYLCTWVAKLLLDHVGTGAHTSVYSHAQWKYHTHVGTSSPKAIPHVSIQICNLTIVYAHVTSTPLLNLSIDMPDMPMHVYAYNVNIAYVCDLLHLFMCLSLQLCMS